MSDWYAPHVEWLCWRCWRWRVLMVCGVMRILLLLGTEMFREPVDIICIQSYGRMRPVEHRMRLSSFLQSHLSEAQQTEWRRFLSRTWAQQNGWVVRATVEVEPQST